MVRRLVRAYPLLFAAQLLLSWSAYGAGTPARPAVSRTTVAGRRSPSRPGLGSPSRRSAPARHGRAPWHRRLAVLSAAPAPLSSRSVGSRPSPAPAGPVPDRAPPEHPPA
ncbi:MAG TPA: hypothetical protein VNI01_12865 [Elusimicrobiota bacterium]|nr:hypothetical protein [Elusimicrobiota bacterium]